MRDSFSHLSTEHARSVGWEARLRQATQERDDSHQERDNAAQKLRASEAKLISLGDRCGESCSYDRSHRNNPRSQVTPRGPPPPRTTEGRACETWSDLGGDVTRGQTVANGTTAFGRHLRGCIGQLTNIRIAGQLDLYGSTRRGYEASGITRRRQRGPREEQC